MGAPVPQLRKLCNFSGKTLMIRATSLPLALQAFCRTTFGIVAVSLDVRIVNVFDFALFFRRRRSCHKRIKSWVAGRATQCLWKRGH